MKARGSVRRVKSPWACLYGDCVCGQFDGVVLEDDDPGPPYHAGCICGVEVVVEVDGWGRLRFDFGSDNYSTGK